jgi:hypothetical protein
MHKIYSSQTIIDNHQQFIDLCNYLGQELKKEFHEYPDITWLYDKYSIFSYASSSILFYDLYKDLNKYIREYVGDDRRIWLQAWLNFLSYDEVESVLHAHGHEWDIHGYISIDPKETSTQFTHFSVKNKIGNIYMGPCGVNYNHKVINDNKWDGNRITIGYDCTFLEDKAFGSIGSLFYPVL